ncbi:hypothetical protein NL676_022810 [Syzygium grande]|nr:hypothetical protein NL676_022810 [Syzygium grande]
MGNCQAAEAAAVAIHHPTGTKVERIHCEPGALCRAPDSRLSSGGGSSKGESGSPSRQLRLLRPDDTLHIGQVYRLISFEDVLKEFAAKKCVKLGKLLERSGGVGVESKEKESTTSRGPSSKRDSASADNCLSTKEEQEVDEMESSSSCGGGSLGGDSLRGVMGGGRQWKPALQSISEIGS